MKLEIVTDDPLKVLETTKKVVEQARFVTLSEDGLNCISHRVRHRLSQGLETARAGFGATGDFIKDVQLIFLQSVVNFCFWAPENKTRWQVEWPKGRFRAGAYGMIASFKRAMVENPNILQAGYLESLDREAVEDFFRSNNQTEIPMMEKRLENLQEAGRVLNQKYKGQFVNALEESGFDAIELARLLYRNFPSFRDTADSAEGEIFFLKRAQICPNDLSYLAKDGGAPMKNTKNLAAFADYKIPQVLRGCGVLKYLADLAHNVDNYVLIPSGSREEIEIRAATVWGVELVRQKLEGFSAGQIDNALWLISQNQTGLKPFHRTYTTFY